LYKACAQPDSPEVPHLCFKLLVEPLRILLWLVHGREVLRRADVLDNACTLLPEECEAVELAQNLRAEIRYSREPRLAEAVPLFLRLCDRIAETIDGQIREAGVTEVELLGSDPVDLTTGPYDAVALGRLVGPGAPLDLLPLVDWRALVISS